jgi:hypothetical integral membrane protein (TIGR02206 family)
VNCSSLLLANGTFRLFGTAHVVAIVLTIAVPVALSLWVRRAGESSRASRAVCGVLAGMLVLNEGVYYVQSYLTLGVGVLVRECLPLHVCGIAAYLTAWALVRRRRWAYEVSYFWGLAGTFQAILTPNLTVDFPAYRFFQFFVTHSGIVAAVLLMTWGLRMRPRLRAVWRVFLLSNALVVVIGALNWALDANYMFLCKPPVGNSPFFFAPWPWYILVLEGVGMVMFLLLYAPFPLADALRRRRGADATLTDRNAATPVDP